jgi:GT2 family glycosyltransferase
MTDRARVRLVVLTYNGRDQILRCFEHLHAVEWPRDRLELVLVDNASRDGSADLVAEHFPDVRILRVARNIGFPANNLALGDPESFDFVGLVNDDAFVEPSYLAPLVEALEADPGLGAASPKMLFASKFADLHLRTTTTEPGRGDPRALGVRIGGLSVHDRNVWRRTHVASGGYGRETSRAGAYEWTGEHAVLQLPIGADGSTPDDVEILLSAPEPKEVTLGEGPGQVVVPVDSEPVWCPAPLTEGAYDVVNNAGSIVLADGHGADRGFGEHDGPSFSEAADVFAWCGGAVLLRSEYLVDVGLFDERFFLYYEDTDLSWRGRARGWGYRYVPTSVVRHLHAATTVAGSSSFAYYTERNRLLMLLKNAPRPMVRDVVGDYLGKTYDAARRDVVAAVAQGRRPNALPVARRLRALAGFVRLAPSVALDRSVTRARQRVPDQDLLERLTPT